MSYEKQTWVTGDIVSAEKLNHMEEGIQNHIFLPYQRRTFWTQSVQCQNPTTDFSVVNINNVDPVTYYNDKCVLYLPSTYTVDGAPTKLILYCKPGAEEINSGSDLVLDQCRYWLYLGYAILGVEGIPSDWCTAIKIGKRVVGNYVAIESFQKAYHYVLDNYNIDKTGCYLYGRSQGGHTTQNLLDNTNINFLAVASLYPVCSMRYHQWDLTTKQTIGGVSLRAARCNVCRIYGFPSFTTSEELEAMPYDATLVNGWDPWVRNVENPYMGFTQSNELWYLPNGTTLDDITMKKYCRAPLKVWVAQNDTTLSPDVTRVFVKAIRNAGQEAEIRYLSSGGHSVKSAQTAIGSFVENGDTVALKPIDIEIARWFERFGGYSVPNV